MTVENFYLFNSLSQRKPFVDELISVMFEMDQDLIKSLFEDILGKVCAMLLKQFTKDVISALQIEKLEDLISLIMLK